MGRGTRPPVLSRRREGPPTTPAGAATSGFAAGERRRSPLAHRDFRLFFVGNVISSSGTWLQNVAQGILVLQLTGRSSLVGLTQALTFVPILLLALHGGQLADRLDRRKLLIWSQLVAAGATGVLAGLAAAHHATVAAIAAVALILGLQYAVAIPASQAMVPSLVPPEDLGPAVGLASVTYNLARVLGPLLATFAVTLLGFGLAFGLNSLSFMALAVAIWAIRPRERQPLQEPRPISEALRYAWRSGRTRIMLAAVTSISLATDPVFTLSPAFARSVLHRATADAGLLVSAFGGGAILAAVTLSRLFRQSSEARRGVGLAALAVMVGGLALFAVSHGIGLSVAGLAVGGVGYLISVTTWTTGIQEEVPNALRGRVMAIWTLCFLGSRPVAAILDGVLADALSPSVAAIVMLAPAVAAAVLVAVGLRPRPPGSDTERGTGTPAPRLHADS